MVSFLRARGVAKPGALRGPGVRVLGAALCMAFAAGAWAQAKSPQPMGIRPVAAPHYGDTLFQFYQERYFTAVTGLMVSQHFQRMAPHDDDAEILRGGLLLSYGMHREAGDIFARLIERGAPPAVRDRAWYFLAKIRYQRGDHAGARMALSQLGDSLPPDLQEDRGLLEANVRMALNDFAGAADTLRGLATASSASFYARFNLGVALVKGGDTAKGVELLKEVGQMPSATEEQRSLRDRANVALGFAALKDGNPEAAREALMRVRLQGMQSSKALLGFGWAEAALKQPAKALVPWTELAGRTLTDASVLEAKIAVPYAYAELGAFGQAHDHYQDALNQFDSEYTALDESIAAIRSGKLIDGLNKANPGEEMGWFWSLKTLPDMPHGAHLTHVLAQHGFQEAFKNYRDLMYLQRNVNQWRESLGAFTDILENRRDAFAKRLPQAQSGAQASQQALTALQARRNALASELKRVEADTDVVAFADPKQDALLQRLASVQATMAAAAGRAELEGLADKVRLVSGALSWQLMQDFPARLWSAKKGLLGIDQELAQAQQRDAALSKAQSDEPARFEAFAKRIAELEARLLDLQPRLAALAEEQQQAVQGMAVAELEAQQQRLVEYRTQARFAVAQLVDRAQLAKSANSQKGTDDAPRR